MPRQTANPYPPVATLPKLRAGVDWRSLFRSRLVADFLIDRPTLHINLKQAKTEIKDKVSLDQRGWQDALEEIYPLKVNEFRVRDANITYVDDGQFKPLRLRRVNFRARNIRNIHSKERVYPSDISLEGDVFGSGKVAVNGHADFLAKPHTGIKGKLRLGNVELDYFKPITRRYHVSVREGALSTNGEFEYAPNTKVVDLQDITIRGVHIDYIHRTETKGDEKEMAADIARTAKKIGNDPEVLLRVDRINLLSSTLAFVNQAAEPDYRIFVANADLKVEHLSSRSAEGKAIGKFARKIHGQRHCQREFYVSTESEEPGFQC